MDIKSWFCVISHPPTATLVFDLHLCLHHHDNSLHELIPIPLFSQEHLHLQTPLSPTWPGPTSTMNPSAHGSHASVDILEELQLIAAQNLEKVDVGKYYKVVRELGKGTYGKVDLVVHKIRGNHRNQDPVIHPSAHTFCFRKNMFCHFL